MSFQAEKTKVGALRAGDTLANCLGQRGKTIERIEKARAPGYLVGFYTDGSWSALGHRLDDAWRWTGGEP